MGSSLKFDEGLLKYINTHTPPEPDLYKRLREETDALGPISEMQITWIQARFMQVIVKMLNANKYLEIGVFTGYSTLAVAEALPVGGKITALDISKDWTSMGQRYWKEAGVDNKINLVLGDACETMTRLAANNSSSYDLAFIDADKLDLPRYFDHAMALVRPGGLILVDNVLWSGAVIDQGIQDENTQAIRSFNDKVAIDDRALISMIPVGDGLTLAVKK